MADFGAMTQTHSGDVELAIVRTQEGANRYGVAIGQEVGSGQKKIKPVALRQKAPATLLSPETQNRIKEYQKKNGLAQTGQLDAETVAHTRLAGAENKAKAASDREAAKAEAAQRRADADKRRDEADKRREVREAESAKRRDEADKRRAEADKRRDDREKERQEDKKKREALAESRAQSRSTKSGGGRSLTKAQTDALLRRRGVALSNHDTETVRLAGEFYGDIELGVNGSKWRHGWIPLNAAAVAIKAKKPGSGGKGTGTPSAPGARGSKRPSAGTRPVSSARSKAVPTADQRRAVAKVAAANVGSKRLQGDLDAEAARTGASRQSSPELDNFRLDAPKKKAAVDSFPNASEVGKVREVDPLAAQKAATAAKRQKSVDGVIPGVSERVSAHETPDGGGELKTADGRIVGPKYKSKLSATRAKNLHNAGLIARQTPEEAEAKRAANKREGLPESSTGFPSTTPAAVVVRELPEGYKVRTNSDGTFVAIDPDGKRLQGAGNHETIEQAARAARADASRARAREEAAKPNDRDRARAAARGDGAAPDFFDTSTAKVQKGMYAGHSLEAANHLTKFKVGDVVVVQSKESGKEHTARVNRASRGDGGGFGSAESFTVGANLRPGGYTYDVTNSQLTTGRLNIRHASAAEREAYVPVAAVPTERVPARTPNEIAGQKFKEGTGTHTTPVGGTTYTVRDADGASHKIKLDAETDRRYSKALRDGDDDTAHAIERAAYNGTQIKNTVVDGPNSTYMQFSAVHLRRMAASGSSGAKAELARRAAKTAQKREAELEARGRRSGRIK